MHVGVLIPLPEQSASTVCMNSSRLKSTTLGETFDWEMHLNSSGLRAGTLQVRPVTRIAPEQSKFYMHAHLWQEQLHACAQHECIKASRLASQGVHVVSCCVPQAVQL
jgi:hypothetical protein